MRAAVRPALHAADTGYRLGLAAAGTPPVGAKLPQRIELAANLAVRHRRDPERLLREMNDLIGFGAYASEAVPSVVGLVIAAQGRVGEAVRLAANAGNQACCTAASPRRPAPPPALRTRRWRNALSRFGRSPPLNGSALWAELDIFAAL